MRRPALTVLTTPILPAARRGYIALRGVARRILKPGVPGLRGSRYPGHYAVTRSVVEGLRAIRADFNFNPPSFSALARVVYAPANEALAQAIDLKRRGKIDFLVAGPVNAFFADESDGIMLSPEIDLSIVAHELMIDFYGDTPELARKSRACPCGVDTEFWKPMGAVKERACVVYWKSGDEQFCEQVEAIVAQAGLEPIRIRSGHGEHHLFKPADMRAALDRSVISVFLSTFESQGIALAEAWAMDVPTLVWDPRSTASWRGRSFISRSSAPYLSAATGISWVTIDELAGVTKEALARRNEFCPREWVLRNMTDEICAKRLLQIIETESRTRLQSRLR